MKNNAFLNNLSIEEIKNPDNNNESSFVFNNLPAELSVTLGNYYRRIILSYMSGISIFAITISNKERRLESEFSVPEGLIETPPYLILNLRKVLISPINSLQDNDENFEMEINIDNDFQEEYIVRAKDMKDLSGKLEVLNPESYIATVSPFSSLKIRIYCKNNWGYRRSEENLSSSSLEEKSLIMIDSNYNPIKNVSYSTDFVVTGFEDQNEKLALKIETNGSFPPKEALVKALNISLSVNGEILDNLKGDDFSVLEQ